MRKLTSMVLIIAMVASFCISGFAMASPDSSDAFGINTYSAQNGFFAEAKVLNGFETVRITLSENIKKDIDFDGIAIYDTDSGESISVSEVTGSGSRILIKTSAALSEGKQYMIEMPESIVSEGGSKLSSPYIYFYADSEEPNFGEKIGEFDFNGRNPFQGEHISTGDEHDMAVKASVEMNNVQFISSAGGITETPGKENIMISFDVFLNKNVHDIDWRIFGENGVMCGMFFFDKGGNFIFINNAGHFYSNDDYIDPTEYDKAYHTYYQLNAEPQSWHRLTALINYSDRTTRYYIDGNYAGTGPWNSDNPTSKITELRVTGKGTAVDKKNFVYVDNYCVGYPKAYNRVESIKIYDCDGRSIGALGDEIYSNAQKVSVWFSDEPDVSTLSTASVAINGAGHNVECKFDYYDDAEKRADYNITSFLKKGEKYDITIDGISAADYLPIAAYHTTFKTSQDSKLSVAYTKICKSGTVIEDADALNTGDTVSPHVILSNNNDRSVKARVGIVVTNNGEIRKSGIKFKEYTVDADSNLDIQDDEELKVTMDNTDKLSAKVIVLDENNNPIADAVSISKVFEAEKTDWTIEMSGTNVNAAGDNICVSLYEPGTDAADENKLVFRDVVKADADGKYCSYVNLYDDPEIDTDALSGRYLLVAKFDGGEEHGSISFTNKNQQRTSIAELNTLWEGRDGNANIKEDIKKLIADNSYAMGITQQFGNDYDMTADLTMNYLEKNGKFDITDEEGIRKAGSVIAKAGLIESVAKGLADDVFKYDAVLGINEGKIKNWYNSKEVPQTVGTQVYNRLKNKAYKSFDEFDSTLNEQFVLSVIKCSGGDGYSLTRKIIDEFETDIGITPSAKADPYRAVSGGDYESYTTLKNAYDAQLNSESGSGSGSSSGKSGGSSGSASRFEMPVTVNKNDKINKDIFDDIGNYEWAKDAIVFLAESGVINGKERDKFFPQDNVTRAEAIKMLVQSFAKGESGAEISFSDVKAGDWFYNYVAIAKKIGLAQGYSDYVFGANDSITREDFAVMLSNAMKYANIEIASDEQTDEFADYSQIADYAKDAVMKMRSENIITGYEDNTFRPHSLCSRAEAAMMLYNIMQITSK